MPTDEKKVYRGERDVIEGGPRGSEKVSRAEGVPIRKKKPREGVPRAEEKVCRGKEKGDAAKKVCRQANRRCAERKRD